MLTLPDDLLAILDEFSDARSEALDHKVASEPDASYWSMLLSPSYWLFIGIRLISDTRRLIVRCFMMNVLQRQLCTL